MNEHDLPMLSDGDPGGPLTGCQPNGGVVFTPNPPTVASGTVTAPFTTNFTGSCTVTASCTATNSPEANVGHVLPVVGSNGSYTASGPAIATPFYVCVTIGGTPYYSKQIT